MCPIKRIPDIFSYNLRIQQWISIFLQECFVENGQLKDGITSHLAWLLFFSLPCKTRKLHVFTEILCDAVPTTTLDMTKLPLDHRHTIHHP